jgi:hypothetical protein
LEESTFYQIDEIGGKKSTVLEQMIKRREEKDNRQEIYAGYMDDSR